MSAARVVAVVPVYRPDERLGDRLASLTAQVAVAVVVDDGSAAAPPAVPGVEFVALAENRGIAAALNAGIARARALGATHVLTVDQDTVLDDGYVATALAALAAATETRIGAAVADEVNGVASVPTWISPEGIALAPEAIQSGMLIPLDCLDDTGGFDESLFIDSVDRDFCHRIRAMGWSVAIARGACIEHAIGRLEPLGRTGMTYEWHEPFRQYYIARNGIILARRYRGLEPEWSKIMLRLTFTEARKIVVNGPRRFKHAIASIAGGWDGLLRRGGRIPRGLDRLLR